jgi:hypothetical protein
LYDRSSYAPKAYQRLVAARVAEAARRHGLTRVAASDHRAIAEPRTPRASSPAGRREPAEPPVSTTAGRDAEQLRLL